MFNAAIPGQSLVGEPKNYAWENPPRMNLPEEALAFHLEELNKPKKMEAILDVLQLDVEVITITEGILRSAVAKGEHSIDVSLIIGPVIHEYIVGLAEATGIDYIEGTEEKDTSELSMYAIRENKARKILEDIKKNKEPDLEDLEASLPEAPEQDLPEDSAQDLPVEMPEEKPKGLMARPEGVM
jgi:hypothetical protein|tara:strand:+ start:118 stop:669 length:552 start_codon:yes stop_codon:yes gene_type:complete